MIKAITRDDAQYAFKLVKTICTEVGPGKPGSSQEKEFVDRFLKQGRSQNVIGSLRKPGTKTVKRLLISLGTNPVLLLVVLALGSLLAVCLELILGVISKDIPSMFATIKGLMLLLYAPGIIYAIPQVPQWIAKVFPTYYIFHPVIQITQNSANAAEIMWEMAVLIGLILLVMLGCFSVKNRQFPAEINVVEANLFDRMN